MHTSEEKKQTFDPLPQLLKEFSLPMKGIQAVVQLLEEGNTIPFIARYRKEATGNLDEVQIRDIQDRQQYLVELHERKESILRSIESQGKLTDELRKKILDCQQKNSLEDLYLPYKPKRRTRAMIAKEKGLEPLALMIYEQKLGLNPQEKALEFVDQEKGVEDVEQALKGARDIVAEKVAENSEVREWMREAFFNEGVLHSKVCGAENSQAAKYKDYFDFNERVNKIPSHRYLAIRRGEKEGFLSFSIELLDDVCTQEIEKLLRVNRASLFCEQFQLSIEDAYQRLLLPSLETDTRVDLKMRSDRQAVDIFAQNLRKLLLAAPLGGRLVVGIDPGLRTGCKCVVVNETGKYLENKTIYLTGSSRQQEEAAKIVIDLVSRYKPVAVAVGNGTGGRETEGFVKKLLSGTEFSNTMVLSVSESGASVYSASEVAREEFPDLDLTIRGSISIARRLQDPLAELVKVDPKAIGVGQYQHDVYQSLLQQKLSSVVESCVNFVGVELNTASAELLSYVSGIGPTMAKKIVSYRNQEGAFKSRKQLLKVSGLGGKTFQQAAGFLRVRGSEHPLDASAVHPEHYSVVEEIAKDLGMSVQEMVGNSEVVEKVDLQKYCSQEVGELTLKDILEELKKPGRDPRDQFERPSFRQDVQSMEDLQKGMLLEGVVTNVTAFGAFVDLGVHQDGLIHVSELSDQFVKDPSEVVEVGKKLKVRVLDVDLARKRISLTAKSGSEGTSKQKSVASKPVKKRKEKNFSSNPFAAL